MNTWDEIIEARIVIKDLADALDVSQNYLVYQTDFLKAVTLNNKMLAVKAINETQKRINEMRVIVKPIPFENLNQKLQNTLIGIEDKLNKTKL